MSQRKPLSQQTLLERLATLERRIDETTRRSTGASVPIAAVQLEEPRTVITLDNLPQQYHALQLHMTLGGTHTHGLQYVQLRFNDHTTNYDFQYTRAAGSATASGQWDNVEHIEAAVIGPAEWSLSSWTNTTIGNYAAAERTFANSHCGFLAGAADYRTWLVSGWYWGQLEAIDRISLHAGGDQPFTPGSTVHVYGLR